MLLQKYRDVLNMRNLRAYYSAQISDFLSRPAAEILGIIHSNNVSSETTIQQRRSECMQEWSTERH